MSCTGKYYGTPVLRFHRIPTKMFDVMTSLYFVTKVAVKFGEVCSASFMTIESVAGVLHCFSVLAFDLIPGRFEDQIYCGTFFDSIKVISLDFAYDSVLLLESLKFWVMAL